MKRSTYFGSILLGCVLGLAGQAFADISSLRGMSSIPETLSAPEIERFVNDKENVKRTFKEQPPVIPHKNDGYDINLKENKCLDCHMKEEGKDEAKSVEMSESHFMNRNGDKLDRPAGARHFCTQCHVPQVDAEPLVSTNFQGNVK